MFDHLYPDICCRSVYEFDFEKAYAGGKRVLGFDIDNTLVPHDAPADRRSAELMARLRAMGFSLMILSNNEEPRVKSFADAVGAGCIWKAGKPGKKAYLRMLDLYGAAPGEALYFGDQLFTDIMGASRSGITSVYCDPIDTSTDPVHITLKRFLEKPFLRRIRCK